jgi:hypothetical protein
MISAYSWQPEATRQRAGSINGCAKAGRLTFSFC